jgi:predicted TIM-barrel fold metal-dependent hydrolase
MSESSVAKTAGHGPAGPPFTLSRGAIDAWINPNLGPPTSQKVNVSYLFPGLAERYQRGTTLPQLIDEMDAAGVARGVLCSGYGDYDDLSWVQAAVGQFPDRFIGSHVIDPRLGLAAVRQVETLVVDHGFGLIRMLGLFTQLPYNDAQYYPVYGKCAELGVPVGLNVGIPGPKVPGKHQDPMAIDDVCAFFPELTIIMQHGGEPWVDLCVKLMLKWENLYYMTSAFAPKHIPRAIVDYINTRGSTKVMFGSDYPLLTFDRCIVEASNIEFRDQERFDNFMTNNAERVLFTGSQP